MRNVRMIVMVMVVVLSLAHISPRLFAVEYVGYNPQHDFTLYTSSSSYGGWGENFNCETSVGVTFDWDAPSILFDSVELNFAGGTMLWVGYFTVAPGETTNVTTTVTIEPFSIQAMDVGPLALTPTFGGKYLIEDNADGTHGGFENLLLTGSYEVNGPTESKTGTFSTLMPVQADYHFPTYELHTSSYPSSVLLTPHSSGPRFEILPLQIVDVIVDNIPIDLSLSKASFSPNGELYLTPEPTTLLLLGFGIVMGRRRKKTTL